MRQMSQVSFYAGASESWHLCLHILYFSQSFHAVDVSLQGWDCHLLSFDSQLWKWDTYRGNNKITIIAE